MITDTDAFGDSTRSRLVHRLRRERSPRNVIANEWTALAGVIQAPGGWIRGLPGGTAP